MKAFGVRIEENMYYCKAGLYPAFFVVLFFIPDQIHTGPNSSAKTQIAAICHVTPCGTLAMLLCIFILLACFSLLIRRVWRPLLNNGYD